MHNNEVRTNPSTEILIAENIKVLREAQKLVEQMDDHIYNKMDEPLFSSSIGSQLRHCLDFYQCFLTGIKAGKVDYDCRERDEATEKSRARAIERIEMTAGLLWKLSFAEEQTNMWVKQDSPYWSISSLRRELQFLLSHLVHHQALMAAMLRALGFNPEAQVGVAPSTLESWKGNNSPQSFARRRPRLSVVL